MIIRELMKKLFFATVFIVFINGVFAQKGIVHIDPIYFHLDESQNILLINRDIHALNEQYPDEKQMIQCDSFQYHLLLPVLNFEYGISYEVSDTENRKYILYFTPLPVISIFTDYEIPDEPRVYAQFALCEKDGHYLESDLGIELRGGWAQQQPKKSYRIEFWKDSSGNETRDFSLLGMRCDDDWNIQAMYNEPLRLRSKTNYDLWRQMNALYYAQDEPEAINGVHQEYVELFLNHQYKGLYALSERVDRKQLKLKKYKNNEINGQLLKGVGWGASTYTAAPPYSNNSPLWSGFEYKYPDEVIDWHDIYKFVDFVVNQDSTTFVQEYRRRFCLENAVDYFIFLNLLRATDNTGKNLYVARYKAAHPWFYVPWDLDGTLGIIYDGTQENITDDILSNGFYDRLIRDQYFTEKLTQRWNELKTNILTEDRMMQELQAQFDYLQSNGVYERELLAWPDCAFFDWNNLDYTSEWLQKRFAYLDKVFMNPGLLTIIDPELPVLEQVRIYPNPVQNYLNVLPRDGIQLKKVQILDLSGRCLLDSDLYDVVPIDVSTLSEGVYFVRVFTTSGERIVRKIIIARH